jgi:hypothetical protein
MQEINSTGGLHISARINLASISAVGGNTFSLSSVVVSGRIRPTLSTVVDVYQSSSLLPEVLRAQYRLLSQKIDGFTISVPLSDLPANSSSGYGPSVTVCLPVNESLLGGRNPGPNTLSCLFWDESSGTFDSDGFEQSKFNCVLDVLGSLP